MSALLVGALGVALIIILILAHDAWDEDHDEFND